MTERLGKGVHFPVDIPKNWLCELHFRDEFAADCPLQRRVIEPYFRKGPGQDPTIPHVALAVADIQEKKPELDRLKVPYWSMTEINGPTAEQIFINDPSGNMVELHQVDQCPRPLL